MDRKNIETFYPLSPMQQGMLFHTLYEPESGIYVELLTATWRGEVDVDAFRRTWQQVVNRHPALRTAFLWEGLKEPIQVVQRHAGGRARARLAGTDAGSAERAHAKLSVGGEGARLRFDESAVVAFSADSDK